MSPCPQRTIGETMSEPIEVFIDGLNQLNFTGGLVRLDFMSLHPEDEGTPSEKKTNLRIIMNAQQTVLLRDSLNTFIQRLQEANVLQNPAVGNRNIQRQNVQRGRTLEERYNPKIFSVSNVDEAKRIILTKEGRDGSEERWRKETPALISLLRNEWRLGPGTTVVDYGCGIGRISKELCKMGCQVLGVDISPEMRRLAIQYVNDDRFSVVTPEEFVNMINNGFSCDYACTIWVLQHCLKPTVDLGNIKRALKNGGGLFVVNNKFSRAVPVIDGVWQNDNIDIWQMCSDNLREVRLLDFPDGVGVDARYFQCGFYQKYL